MNTLLPARLRIPLSIALIGSLSFWAMAIPVRADDAATGPEITVLEAAYPFWITPFFGGNQDSFKFGDQTTISVETADDAMITSVTAYVTGLGIPIPVPVRLFLARDAQHAVYRAAITINTHESGAGSIFVRAIDSLGRVAAKSIDVRVDNTPPQFSIDSLSFANATATPALEDTMLVSGAIDPSASKAFVTDAYYTLYAQDGTPLPTIGSFKPKYPGVALADLGPGAFTDDPIQLWFDRNTEFHVPEAASIGLTAEVIDGAGNKTTARSPLVRIPKAAATVFDPNAVSNVLFLPGIEGSRLYAPVSGCDPAHSDCVERQLWDPASDSDLSALSLDASGASMHGVYAKEGDVVDALGPFMFYRSFFDDLNGLRDAGTINDWRAVAYDWRLSPEALVQGGVQQGARIEYGQATSTPYIAQTLRALAARSKSGKVTIIAHSAGGLVTKALLQKLGDAETARLVDKVIFVGVPQSGTPQALAGLLHGYGTALPADWCAAWEAIGSFCAKNASRSESRALAENAAMMYDLLPSSQYFSDVLDPLHPVVSFIADHLFANERAQYGSTIDTESEQIAFAADADGGRSKPAPENLALPNVLNANLLGLAHETHGVLDAWVPPSSVNVYQIAGWGADTLSGMQYYEAKKASAPGGYVARYRPQFVEDGDATVTVPSALMMPAAQNVKRYWIDLTKDLALQPIGGASHANLFELGSARSLIQGILAGTQGTLPHGIVVAQPAPIDQRKRLLFTLHGSAEATLTDDSGNASVLHADGSTAPGLPGVQAGMFGDTGFFLTPAGIPYRLLIAGTAEGVDVDVQHLIDDVVTGTATFEDVAASTSAAAEIDISADGTTAQPAPVAASTPPPAGPIYRPGKILSVVRTKGIANSRSVLTPPKPIPLPKVAGAATSTKKAATPKAKPLTKKAKTAISALLDQLTAQLQGLLTKLPR